ncbi:MAG: metal-dependent transcriptional regulator [Defluviitaleaceae bacterium]|nr:metal-dependent transcriptional regulator [Defluviitaleaceae bacterium]
MIIKSSAEDYLEAIFVLSERQGRVKSVDVANHMNFSKPTISIQMKHFRNNGYIFFDEKRYICLTEKGEEIARRIHERHIILSKILMAIGVCEEQAYEDACKIEHAVSNETFDCIKVFYDKLLEMNVR